MSIVRELIRLEEHLRGIDSGNRPVTLEQMQLRPPEEVLEVFFDWFRAMHEDQRRELIALMRARESGRQWRPNVVRAKVQFAAQKGQKGTICRSDRN